MQFNTSHTFFQTYLLVPYFLGISAVFPPHFSIQHLHAFSVLFLAHVPIQCFRDISVVFPALILLLSLHGFSVLFPRVGSAEHSIRVTTRWIINRKKYFWSNCLKNHKYLSSHISGAKYSYCNNILTFETIWICPSKFIFASKTEEREGDKKASSMAGMAKE